MSRSLQPVTRKASRSAAVMDRKSPTPLSTNLSMATYFAGRFAAAGSARVAATWSGVQPIMLMSRLALRSMQ